MTDGTRPAVLSTSTEEDLRRQAAGRLVAIFEDFHDPSQERRRLFPGLLGTFFLVLVPSSAGSYCSRR
jgi:hypothetical protein